MAGYNQDGNVDPELITVSPNETGGTRLPGGPAPTDGGSANQGLTNFSNDLGSVFDSRFFQGIRNVQGKESSEDLLTRFIRDQMSSARARYNRLGVDTGAKASDLAAALDPLKAQLGALDNAQGLMSGFTGRLVNSGVASTAGASAAAVGAARLSGDGRFGAGGNAAAFAARGAVDAAVGQSSAIAQALVQGQMSEANFQSNILQQRGGIAAALSQVLQQQNSLLEDRGKLGVAMDTEHAQILSGALQTYGGIRQAREQKDPKAKAPSIFGLI